MKIIFLLFISLMVNANTGKRPDFADPMILKAKGKYYAFATGLKVAESSDLINWKVLPDPMPVKPTWAQKWNKFWAPHVVEYKNKFYLFYSAQPDWSHHENMRLGVAVSDNPEGPYTDIGKHLDTGDAEENIDSMPFIDPVSKRVYLYWGRNGVITVQEMNDELTGFEGEYKEILFPGKNEYEKIVEGPYIIFEKGNYYLFTSGDDCCTDPHYAVMVAKSKSPFGPFTKRSSPSLKGDKKIQNPGHNAVFKTYDGKLQMVYHGINPAHSRDEEGIIYREMHISPVHFKNDWPVSKVNDSLPLIFN